MKRRGSSSRCVRQAAAERQRALQQQSEREARLKAEREAAIRAGRAAHAEAQQLAALADQERAEKEALMAELEALKLAKENEAQAKLGSSAADYSSTGLTPFPKATSETAVFEKGVYAWTAAAIDESLTDEQILDALAKRLKYVHTTAATALAECVRQPSLARQPEAFAEYGVEPQCFLAFAAQLLYNVSEGRAAKLLGNVSGGLPIVPVLRFLGLFGGGGGGGGGGGAELSRLNPKGRKVDELSSREKGLLMGLRDFLFEQRSKMKAMFEKCDLNGDGYVSIEEFLTAMEKAGMPVAGEINRRRAEKGSITEDEAMNIVAFFDRDGDGLLSYSEFMNCLQTTKTSIMATKVLDNDPFAWKK